MAKFIAAENVEIWFVPALTSLTAPDIDELNAGTRLTTKITGGVNIDFASNLVDAATLESAFNSTVAGTYGGGINSLVGLLRDNVYANDTAWQAFPRGTAGYLCINTYNIGTVWASADRVDIYPIEVVARNPGDMTRDALVDFDVEFAITSAPTLDSIATA
jgi:hypothetical protein